MALIKTKVIRRGNVPPTILLLTRNMDHSRRLAGPDLLDTKTVTSNHHRTLPEILFPWRFLTNQNRSPSSISFSMLFLEHIRRKSYKFTNKCHLRQNSAIWKEKIIAPDDLIYVKKWIKYQTIYREIAHESGIDEKNISSGLRTFAMGESNQSPSKSGKL